MSKENKTQPSKSSVASFINNISDENKRKDCKTLLKLMSELSQEKPILWGESMIGFGTYHYKYDSGREGDFFRLGFSPRKSNLTIYLMPGYHNFEKELKALGKHKIGKSCLYINKLTDIDIKILTKMIKQSLKEMDKMYPRNNKN